MIKKGNLIYKLILLFISSMILLNYQCDSKTTEQDKNGKENPYSELFEKGEIKISDITVEVDIADTDEKRTLGLMYRKKLDYDKGMIFIFDDNRIRSFWMKNTYIALDIAFVDEDLNIIEVLEMTPLSEKSVRSSRPAKYVIEMNKGWFADNNVYRGAKIEIVNLSFQKDSDK